MVRMPSRASLLCFVLLLFCSSSDIFAVDGKLTRFVDPFVGTANGGNTFPGAVRPWGMVSVSPHTDLQSPSGYVHGRPWFYGLGQVHLSGTGCADLGSIIVTCTAGDANTSPDRYKCRLRDEQASPGYWAGTLVEPSIRAEATATVRSGIIRFVPIRKRAFTVLVDAGHSLSLVGGGASRWVSDRELEGFNTGGGFCGEGNRHVVYFVARFSRIPTTHGTWRDSLVTRNSSTKAVNASVGAWARYESENENSLEVRIGISYVSIANARSNLRAEAGSRPFEDLRAEADAVWEQELSRILISGGTSEDLTKFYTALYHTMIHPNIISDVNGEYPLFGRSGTGRNPTREHYTVFSLWDTYRTLHPLLSLIYPERQSAIVNTMLDMYKEAGWLPKWELAGNETHMMVGDGAVPVIADTYTKGIRDWDTLRAYEAMRKPGTVIGPEAEPSRPGYHDYLRLGYIHVDQDTTQAWWVWGPVSTTLEYCLADWTFSQVAAAMGRFEDANEYRRRSLFYRNLFDTTTRFLRPRYADGRWLSPFEPTRTEGSGNWAGSGGPGYVEGNAWQYSWFVPHDVEGLAHLYGGTDQCAEKLEECFAAKQFTINNEPDISYPYLFTYLPGHEHRAAELVREIMRKEFAVGPAGLPGNDDAGTISAWYVFSALGFYPACPGSGEYRLGVPLFEEARIFLNQRYYPGTVLKVRLRRSSQMETRLREVSWNGTRNGGYGIDHAKIVLGGDLAFEFSK
jgi:predicted alpha-1,2-mannosidase